MNIPCPDNCGRRLPLSADQIRDITHERWKHEHDLADTYNCTISTIRHLRSLPPDVLRSVA